MAGGGSSELRRLAASLVQVAAEVRVLRGQVKALLAAVDKPEKEPQEPSGKAVALTGRGSELERMAGKRQEPSTRSKAGKAGR